MSLDLAFDDASLALGDALAGFARDHDVEDAARAFSGGFSPGLWKALAELGVFELALPEGEGGPVELAAAFEALGSVGFPGPLVATVFAVPLLESELRGAVVGGESIVSVGSASLFPYAEHAGVFLEALGDRAWRVQPEGLAPVETLGGEVWGRAREVERLAELDGVAAARPLADLARAAWLLGAARRLLQEAADHARARQQFGRAIGEFQAVAHPLADCWIRQAAAEGLERRAAHALADARPDAAEHAAAARLSAARAGVRTLEAAHQALGALGITLEGPALPSLPPRAPDRLRAPRRGGGPA